jgi:hypothetical protein
MNPSDKFGSFEIVSADSPSLRQSEFYALVGLCIKEWAKVEDQLFHLCTFALKAAPQQAAIVYFRTPAIDSRLKLTNELVLSILPKRAKKDGGHDHKDVVIWKKLVGDINDLLPIRNLIAHGPVVHHIHTNVLSSDDEQNGRILSSTMTVEIATSPHERLRERQGSHSVRDQHLPTHLKEIVAVWNRLRAFYAQLTEALPAEPVPHKSPQSPDPSAAPIRSRQKKRKTRPRSSRG